MVPPPLRQPGAKNSTGRLRLLSQPGRHALPRGLHLLQCGRFRFRSRRSPPGRTVGALAGQICRHGQRPAVHGLLAGLFQYLRPGVPFAPSARRGGTPAGVHGHSRRHAGRLSGCGKTGPAGRLRAAGDLAGDRPAKRLGRHAGPPQPRARGAFPGTDGRRPILPRRNK